MTLARITGFRLVTQDGERLARFYAALGFKADDDRPIAPDELALLGIAGGGMRRRMRIGNMHVDLDRFDRPGARYPGGTNAASACFQHLALVTDDVAAAWTKALAAGARSISRDGPVTLPPNTGGVTAIKFRDSEGHPLELIRFPDGAAHGWEGQRVFGIDHSALVATDLAASRDFYAGHALAHGAATLNHGSEQDRLDGLDDVRVDVVPMLPASRTPHVELLHYRTPTGAPCPSWQANDVAATRIVWRGDAPALLRDPDGHFHQVER